MRFSKLHGLGNDFVVVDHLDGGGPALGADDAKRLCDRRRGIGADGLLVLTSEPGFAARMEVINSDGSRAEMCGNGLRCVARYLWMRETGVPEPLRIMTGAGPRRCAAIGDDVEIEMGTPSAAPRAVTLELAGERFEGVTVSMGNPHLILFDTNPGRAGQLGPLLERHPFFPDGANVSFATVGPDAIDLIVWERGAGLTQACGTGACATVVAAVERGLVPSGRACQVRLPGGMLQVTPLASGEVLLRGPAVFVYDGELDLVP